MIEKSTKHKVLEYFFIYPNKVTYPRELSRELKLSMPTILSSIKYLKEINFITIKKGKAMDSVSANIENKDFIRMKRTDNIEKLYSSKIVDFLYEEFRRPQAIVCFGSYSRGEDTENSDINMAIIKGTKKELLLEKYEKKLNRKISIHFIDLNKVSNEFKTNLCNGIVLEGAL